MPRADEADRAGAPREGVIEVVHMGARDAEYGIDSMRDQRPEQLPKFGGLRGQLVVKAHRALGEGSGCWR